MPRDSSSTKDLLVRAAERLFARRGLYQVTIREITEEARQRNVSAVNYHFGSREGLLDAILEIHGDPTDEARGKALALFGSAGTTRQLLASLVVPYGAHLRTARGRDYLRIVVQMASNFGTWHEDRPGSGPWLKQILEILECRPRDLPPAVRKERVVQMIMLMTTAMAERARAIEDGATLSLDEATFLGNLTDVLVSVIEAPSNGPRTELQLS